jgi:hypothetical protein
MKTPDSTLVQQAAFAAAAGAYVAGMRGAEYIAFVVLCGLAIIADAMIRRGRASIEEAAQYAQPADAEGE